MKAAGLGAILPAAALLLVAGCGPTPPRDMSALDVAAELRKVEIEPGLWETNSQVVDAAGPNMPIEARARMMRHRQNVRNCITPEHAAHPEGNFLRMEQGRRCTYRDFSTEDGRITGLMRCTGGGLPGTMTTRLEGRHNPRAYDVIMHMASEGMPGGADVTITARTIARRIGECPAVAAAPFGPAVANSTAPEPEAGGTRR